MEPRMITGRDGMYRCGTCSMLYQGDGALRQAEQCCQCAQEGCEVRRMGYWIFCPEHMAEKEEEKRQLRLAEEAALPMVSPDFDGMVWCNHQWYDSLDMLIDEMFYGDNDVVDWAAVVVHPGIKSRVTVPSLRDYVSEHWSDQYGEREDDPVSDTVEKVLAGVEEWLIERAPVVWICDTKHRIDMVAATVAIGGAGVIIDPESPDLVQPLPPWDLERMEIIYPKPVDTEEYPS